MDPEKIGKLIKEIRKKNNLSQQKFAEKYGVTYQAVSKWENGKNIPDILLLKRISDDFEIGIDGLLEGKASSDKVKGKNNNMLVLVVVVFILSIIIFISVMVHLLHADDFKFKTLSTGCSNFTISGSIAYNANKSSIYISEVKYCGGDDNTKYKFIECSLYEEINNVKTLITTCESSSDVTLEDFLKDIKIGADDYKQNCRNYVNNRLYLEISATDSSDKKVVYEVPLILEDNCQF